jgi:hypothetical protein
VVGLPLNMDGTDQWITARARRFANRLRVRSGLPVHLADERLSTREAWARLIESGRAAAAPIPWRHRSFSKAGSPSTATIAPKEAPQVDPPRPGRTRRARGGARRKADGRRPRRPHRRPPEPARRHFEARGFGIRHALARAATRAAASGAWQSTRTAVGSERSHVSCRRASWRAISPPVTPAASTTPAHRRSMPRKRNPRPPHHRRCPDCARGCTTAPLRLASCAPRPPPPS